MLQLDLGCLATHLDLVSLYIFVPAPYPSYHLPLASSDNRRQAFLDDYDDQTSDSDSDSDSDSVLASPSLPRRSSRLAATPASDHCYCYSHTAHHSEWAASDLTGRFPIPFYLGHEYILVTLHRGFIHYHAMKSRTAPAYVSAFKAVLSFFSSNGFPITNLKLDNESSSQLSALFVRSCTRLPSNTSPRTPTAQTPPSVQYARRRTIYLPPSQPHTSPSLLTVGTPSYP